MSPLPVSSKRLANCTVRFRDASLANCALVPLFDARGVTAKVALLSAATRECWVLEWRPDLAYVSVLRGTRVDAPRMMPQESASGGTLWFFDRPGLIELGLAGVYGPIAARNAAAVLPKTVANLMWRRDLSRISSVWNEEKSGGGMQLGKWNPDWLADAPPQSPAAGMPARPLRGWVLDPVWMR